MAPISDVPREVFEQILAHVPKDDLRTSVCLVCKSWVRPVREIIFTDVSVLGMHRSHDFPAFTAFLSASPDICRIIRHLVLHGGRRFPQIYMCANDLDAILTLLPNLRSLSLEELQWYKLEDPPVALHGPYNLQKLRIYDMTCNRVDKMLQLLGLFGTINELSISRMTVIVDFAFGSSPAVSDFVEGIVHSETFPSHLKVLSFSYDLLNDVAFYCRLFIHTQTAQALHSFSLQLPRTTGNPYVLGLPEPDIVDFLHAASGLQNLTIDLEGLVYLCLRKLEDLNSPREYISTTLPSVLAPLRALTSCTVRMGLMGTYDWLPDVWAIYIQVVLALPLHIHRIELLLEDGDYIHTPEEMRWRRSCNEMWLLKKLDMQGLQSALQRFPDLNVVVFRSTMPVKQAAKARIKVAFPELAKKGLIRFDND